VIFEIQYLHDIEIIKDIYNYQS